jgi:hypothetical protein
VVVPTECFDGSDVGRVVASLLARDAHAEHARHASSRTKTWSTANEDPQGK